MSGDEIGVLLIEHDRKVEPQSPSQHAPPHSIMTTVSPRISSLAPSIGLDVPLCIQ